MRAALQDARLSPRREAGAARPPPPRGSWTRRGCTSPAVSAGSPPLLHVADAARPASARRTVSGQVTQAVSGQVTQTVSAQVTQTCLRGGVPPHYIAGATFSQPPPPTSVLLSLSSLPPHKTRNFGIGSLRSTAVPPGPGMCWAPGGFPKASLRQIRQ